ncbi:hypothetical protein SAV14893_053370 [Streptomyces avermitilis]|uniref:Uncharacterized protein n=1 Tax=Streptomyces avermitilis TaxID=33903 RepID=A0A4D4M2B8_STRAX|nr:hypothetical protein SAVMC3_65630 [Streptomyces avermitilis]GDY65944.1 hypothetical protein SAV14893_053370 [Streptomyces avermitilis]GDY73838.1 hypothetical protein SAV31267_033230 [Streptomyces avermitilis]GDY82920.1 hypothetical protein SAVCW2_21190 [Streptomyces avermitilis]
MNRTAPGSWDIHPVSTIRTIRAARGRNSTLLPTPTQRAPKPTATHTPNDFCWDL